MQQTSSLYRQLLANENHRFETRIVIGEGGSLVNEGGDRIIFGGNSIVVSRGGPDSGYTEEQIFSVSTHSKILDNKPEIGRCISQELEVKMLNPSGDLPRMGAVVPYVRVSGYVPTGIYEIIDGVIIFHEGVTISSNILTFAESTGATIERSILVLPPMLREETSEWLQQGEFFIDTREVTHNSDGLDVLTLHAYDAMLRGHQPYESRLSWPALTTNVTREIARLMGLDIDSRTWNVMNTNYTIQLRMDYMLIEYLGYIASMYLGNWIITENGELRLVGLLEMPKETRFLADHIGDRITFGGTRILV